jgi:[glutamine synthetase] adenylyltransferase / [glutamine synthetase]-adenylyl-L-tyrosine phosphorylase
VKAGEGGAASFGRLAETIGGVEVAAKWRAVLGSRGVRDEALEVGVLLACAYPAMAPLIEANPGDVIALARGGARAARDARFYRRAAAAHIAREGDLGVKRGLRVLARREKLRIALRELLPQTSGDVDVTAQELSDLADACIAAALDEALAWADARFGFPMTSQGERCSIVVLGMGKLGGRELNCGSDIDLVVFYGTDDGVVLKDGMAVESSLHEYFTRVTQRLISTLDDDTPDGRVWRVDMRLRPEGTRGPLVNALAAAERYYETWGRTWERAALVRARPVAGDLEFGKQLTDALAPFVWRRSVDPGLADAMIGLVERARAEEGDAPEVDLKIGVGGIREAEFFVQALQLVWGGRDPRLRSPSTLRALKKLRARGFVTDREAREVESAYLLLRRLEHRVQFATGLQTHALPKGELLQRIARSLGFARAEDLSQALEKAKGDVHRALLSLRPLEEEIVPASVQSLAGLFLALDSGDEAHVLLRLEDPFGKGAPPDLARHLLALSRRPDAPLGSVTRDKLAGFASALVRSLADAADPEQAARFMARFFARLSTPSVYARALSEGPERVQRMANLFGASAFLGEVLVGHPELADRILFGRGLPGAVGAVPAVDEELSALSSDESKDPEAFVGALRRAKRGLLLEVGLADLAEDIGSRECRLTLSALADATIDHATRFAMRERGHDDLPLAVVAMGKLGGREIGYGSDLDLVFVYDDEDGEPYVRIAQRVLRLVGAPHGEGPGYELDTRLRPSGSHGLLVVGLGAFARYHGLDGATDGAQAHDWERQALVKARPCAGSAAVGKAFLALAHAAAYDRGAPDAPRVHHLRTRMEQELGGERRAADDAQTPGRSRYDLKVGRGGLVDVEFAVQWLQMKHGKDPRVRTPETEAALGALEACGYLDSGLAATLREGYAFLRKLEQRLRVLHGGGASLIEDGAPGLPPLARRMGIRDQPQMGAGEALLLRYRAVTEDVRAAYLAVLGL